MAINPVVYNYVTKEVNYPDKGLIIKEGDPSDRVYLILSGRVKVKVRTGKGTITLETLRPGAVIGEMFLIEGPGKRRSATVVADGPARVGIMNSQRLIEDYEALSPKMQELIRSIFISLKRANEKVIGLAG